MGALKKTLVRRSDSQELGSIPAVNATEVDLLADFDGFLLNARAGGFHDVEGRGHDFRADAVAVRDGDGNKVRCHMYSAIKSDGRRNAAPGAASRWTRDFCECANASLF